MDANARSAERAHLSRGAQTLGVALDDTQAESLLRLLDELEHWNKAYSLTAVTDRAAMLTHHLLDSLAVQPDLTGASVADVGTGAGFPGLPLALVNATRRFTLIDSVQKKTRFVAHAARTLNLANVDAVHARAESLRPPAPFDSVVARALAPLPELLATVRGLCGPASRVIAMKGRRPHEEIAAIEHPWVVESVRDIVVPGLDAARCAVVCKLSA